VIFGYLQVAESIVGYYRNQFNAAFYANGNSKRAIQQRRPKRAIHKRLGKYLPPMFRGAISCSLMPERKVLNTALEKYRPGQSEPVLSEVATCSNLR
jgi:hypothetical protein